MEINKSDLRLDYFLDKERPLYQHPKHFHFNTDTKLLANFCAIRKGERILDIGCNNGALLYACDQYDVKELVGVEIFDEACLHDIMLSIFLSIQPRSYVVECRNIRMNPLM